MLRHNCVSTLESLSHLSPLGGAPSPINMTKRNLVYKILAKKFLSGREGNVIDTHHLIDKLEKIFQVPERQK